MSNPVPTVTVSILNYQRKDTLRRTLQSVTGQHYPDLEIVVVDNCSTDGSAQMVSREFPGVRVISLEQNVGCAARNAGVDAATGDIVVTLDNDVLLTNPDSIDEIVRLFAAHPTVGCVNFKILDLEGHLSTRDWCHPRDWRRFADVEFRTTYVLEGASAFRKHAFVQAGGYWPLLFIGHEGLDLALRLLDAGLDILYSPRVAVQHLASLEARSSSRIYYTFIRNAMWVSARNHRPIPAAREITKDLALMAFSALRGRHVGAFLRGVVDGLTGLPAAISWRKPLHPSTYRRLRELRLGEPGLLAKAWRHWRERPI